MKHAFRVAIFEVSDFVETKFDFEDSTEVFGL